MHKLHPTQVHLDAVEVLRANRVLVAKYLGIRPSEVDAMPASEVDDVIQVMWFEAQGA